jgi:hypothetical protein
MDGHKLDMRFFVLLRRSGPQPLAYLSHAFVVRIANLPYGLNNFHEYQRCAPSMARLAGCSFLGSRRAWTSWVSAPKGRLLSCVFLYARIDVRVIFSRAGLTGGACA